MRKSWLVTCLINFCFAASMGTLLRYVYIHPVAVNYAYVLHGHSHTAMLGWVYLMLYSFIFHYFIPKRTALKQKYNRLFWVTELSIVGMLISFPLQGYALLSLFFSTSHIFCSYYFCYSVWRDKEIQHPIARRMLCTALLFMLFSTIGVWCLGPIMAMGGKSSAIYQVAIQFFIHFQFNGWFVFGILALLFQRMGGGIGILCNRQVFNWFYYSFIIATLLTFALPVSWYIPLPILQRINQVGLLMQLISAVAFFKLIVPLFKGFMKSLQPFTRFLYQLGFFVLLLKTGMQSMTFFPEIALLPHSIRNFTIGFVHLSMLGLVTGFLMAFSSELKYFYIQANTTKLGLSLFGICFVITELLLFIQGAFFYWGVAMIPGYYSLLFSISLGLPLGLLLMIVSISYKK